MDAHWLGMAWYWWAALAWFAVWEARALADSLPGNTLSEGVRALAGIDDWRERRSVIADARQTRFGKLRRTALLFLMAWLVAHFFFPGWF